MEMLKLCVSSFLTFATAIEMTRCVQTVLQTHLHIIAIRRILQATRKIESG